MIFAALQIGRLVYLFSVVTRTEQSNSKKGFFSFAHPDEATGTRVLIASFQSPSELSCSQKCIHNDKCTYKLYNISTKRCDLLSQISQEEFSENALITRKETFTSKTLPTTVLDSGCGLKCTGHPSSAHYMCNCTKEVVYNSCNEALISNNLKKANYTILPLNLNSTLHIECMRDGSGKSFGVFHHDQEQKTPVSGYEALGSYKKFFHYTVSMSTIITLVNNSSFCQQHTRDDCRGAVLFDHDGYNSWLIDRNGNQMKFWGGGPVGGRGCACGITSSCAVTSKKCNCDTNDGVWRFDEGNVVHRDVLPITGIAIGDTGSDGEDVKYTVGPLLCVI